jgi:hypothetical protein
MDVEEKGGLVVEAPTREELVEVFGTLIATFCGCWPTAETILPHVPGRRHELLDHEQIAYYGRRDEVLAKLLAFMILAPALPYVRLQVGAEDLMTRMRTASEVTLSGLLRSRAEGA